MEMKRAALELAQRLVIEIAGDVSRQIANDEPHDLVLDPTTAITDRGRDALVDFGHGQPARGDRRQLDERPRRRQRVKGVRAALEILLDDPLSSDAGNSL